MAQLPHWLAPAPENLPAAHPAQVDAPEFKVKWPALQLAQLDEPTLFWAVPATQLVHAAAPSNENLPAEQSAEAAARPGAPQ